MKYASLLGASALLLAACEGNSERASAPADPAANPAAPSAETMPSANTPTAPTDARNYVAMAGAADRWEIESSRAILAKTSNDAVKDFAQMMIEQHEQSTAKIKAAAGTADIDVTPPRLDGDQQRMLDEIQRADAAGADAIYLRHQRTAHDKALALHQGYADQGDTARLKQAASEIVAVVEMHRRQLDKLGNVAGAASDAK